MIFETELSKKLKEGDYLGDITFISDKTLIDESFNIYGNKMKAFIRNKDSDNLNHHRTFKLKSANIAKYNSEGIPIIFDKIIDGKDSDGNEIYHFVWQVDPDAYNNKTKKYINKCIGSKESEFIDKVLNLAGDEMIEYWSLKSKTDHKRMLELERKYDGFKI